MTKAFAGVRTRSEGELLHPLVGRICELHERAKTRALLVGLSGIDASGKGYLAIKLENLLSSAGLKVALIGIDGWLNLPHARFSMARPGEHFYEHGIRLREMFERLVLPLRDQRSLNLETDYTEETAREYRRHRYEFGNVDVVLLEGIFLFKREFRNHFDLACWIECSFETALQRAILRGQEGLPPEQTIRAYETTYFPAQRLHLERDQPRETADLIIPNDHNFAPLTPQA